MPYTHSTKVGNVGDIAKHPLVARLVEHLSNRGVSPTFTYAETHTGRPTYVLERNGEWQDGIGRFYNKLKGFSHVARDFPNLKLYRDLFLKHAPAPGSEYPGSSGLVYQVLKCLGRPYRFSLCDTDPAVCADLMSYFPQWDQVTVCRGNGFNLIEMIEKPSLVLIDPAYLETGNDKRAILRALRLLDDKNIPMMCWTPRVEPAENSETGAVYPSYEEEVSLRFGSVSVKWAVPEPKKFWGCHIAVSKHLVDIAQDTADEVRKIMEWDS